MALLFPYACTITTPGNQVAALGPGTPPEALSIAEERGVELLTLLSGKSLARFAGAPMLRRFKITNPEGHAVPTNVKNVLRGLALGDLCQLSENLSSRTAVTVWTNLMVSAVPVLTRIGYDRATDTEYYGYQLEFIQTEI